MLLKTVVTMLLKTVVTMLLKTVHNVIATESHPERGRVVEGTRGRPRRRDRPWRTCRTRGPPSPRPPSPTRREAGPTGVPRSQETGTLLGDGAAGAGLPSLHAASPCITWRGTPVV